SPPEEPSDDDDDDEGDPTPDGPGIRARKTVLPVKPGLNRVVWDLRYAGAEFIQGAKVDQGSPTDAPVILPGDYTLKLTADGQTQTATLKVLPDPRWPSRMQEAAAEGQRFALKLRDDITRLSLDVKHLRSARGQLRNRARLLADDPAAADLIKQGKALIDKLTALEERFHNPKAKGTYDILAMKGGAQLYSQLVFLYAAALDDGAPTQGMREVYLELAERLNKLDSDWQALKSGDLGKYNEAAKKLEVPGVYLPKPAPKP